MRKFNLIIDSSCDLPADVINVEGVFVARVSYIMDGATHEDDGFALQTPHSFYEKMRNGMAPTTSQPSVDTLNKVYEQAYEAGLPAVFLVFSSGLGGNFDTACMVAKDFKREHADFELHVVDTLLPSIAEGLLVQEAINQMNDGVSAAELVSWAEEARYFVDALFMVEDLETLKRGGRIVPTVAVAGGKLDLKPLINFTLDGKLKIAGVARGRKKGIAQLENYFKKNSINSFAIVGDADCPNDAHKLANAINKADKATIVTRTNIGPVIGSHVGPGMLAVAFWSSDRRDRMSIPDKISKAMKAGKNGAI